MAEREPTIPEFRDVIAQDVSGSTAQLQVIVRGFEDLIKAELKIVRDSQEFIERRQVKLEQVLVDWMSKASSYESRSRVSRDQTESVKSSKKINDSIGSVDALLKHVPSQLEQALQPDSSYQERPSEPESSTVEPIQLTRWSRATPPDDMPILQRMVFNHGFDLFFSALIFLNAIVIGADVEYKTIHEKPSTFFKVTSFTFAFLFTLELFMRLAAYGIRGFFNSRSPAFLWNLFDCLMVLVSVVEVVDTIATGGDSGSGGAKSLLRLIRMARLMRIIRVLRFSPELRIMIFMVFESAKSLSYVMSLIVGILYVFSIIFTMGGTEYLGVPGGPDFDTQMFSREVQKYYGTIPRSLYTCFRSMTGGQSWGEVMDPLVDISPFYVGVFLFFIAFSVFTLLNIVTGVFVEAVTAKAQTDRDLVVEKELARKKACVQNLQILFEESDSDGSGEITMKEFMKQLQDEKVLAYLSHMSIDTSNIQELFQKLDKDGSGSIEIDEFVDNMMHLMRGRTVEEGVQKLMNEHRYMQRNFSRFIAFVEAEFKHVKASVELRGKLLEEHGPLSGRRSSTFLRNSVENGAAESGISNEAARAQGRRKKSFEKEVILL